MQIETNPFLCGRPVTDPTGFFGRQNELRRLQSHLRNLHWVSIVGPRRIGKTSLLLHLCHADVATKLGLGSPKFVMAFIDCQGLTEIGTREWWSLLVERAAKAAGHTPGPAPRTGFEFREAIRRVLAPDQKLVLICDEFEYMAKNPHLNADFFSLLRSLSTDASVAMITASCAPLLELTYSDKSVLSSPFFNVFNTLRIGLLDEPAARALLSRPEAGFAPETVNFLLELAGPHPFYLQLAGHIAFEQQQEGRLEEKSAERVRRELAEAMEPHLKYAWEHLSTQARHTLITLSLARPGEAALEELEAACLVHNGNYLSPLVEDFVRRQTTPDVLQVGELLVDLRRRRALWSQKPLYLSDLSYRLLCYFLAHTDQPIHWLQLEREVWGQLEALPEDYIGNPERVNAGVDRLRKALVEAGVGNPILLQSDFYTFQSNRVGTCPS